jgi:signal transduction histidine kinase
MKSPASGLSLQRRLTLAFVAVALISIAAVVALTGAATRAEFERYFMQDPQGPASSVDPAGRPPERLGPPFPFWRHRQWSPEMRGRIGRALGAPEVRFLMQLRRATWLAALTGILAAIILGAVVARYVTSPLRQMASAAARVGRGDLTGGVPVPSEDDLGRLALAFNAMTADLRRLEEHRKHMTADIAHELRTPLAVLQANLEGMLDGVVDASPERLAALHTQVRLLSRLVDDLRDLSLAQAGRLVLNRMDTDLRALVTDAVAVLLPRAQEKGVALAARLDAGDDLAPDVPPLSIDRDRILQVIHNLLDNAIRHTPAGGSVAVSLGVTGQEVHLAVHDTGPGIPPEEVDRVFERFYRLDASRARASGGTGLGLSVVKSLVDAHGGRVWVESVPGKGSTFTVALPVQRL